MVPYVAYQVRKNKIYLGLLYQVAMSMFNNGLRVLISMMGKSTYAFLNGYLAVIKYHNYIPHKVFVLFDEYSEGTVPMVWECIKYINTTYEISCSVEWLKVKHNDIKGCMHTYMDILKSLPENSIIAIDITAGRKYMVSSVLVKAWSSCHHVFFLQSETLDPVEMPIFLRARYNLSPLDLKAQETFNMKEG